MSRTMKRILSFAKYPVALAILVYVLRQADTQRMLILIEQAPPLALVGALAAFTLAQWFAVLRMNVYYAHAGRPINLGYSLRLHYVALFYNIILPGGIGGDGYKVYILKKQVGYPAGEGIRIQLLTRTNGLLVLLISLALTLPFLDLPIDSRFVWSAAIGLIGCGVAGYFVLMPYILKATRHMELRALPYSCGVQGCNVLCMVALWMGFSDGTHLADYIFLFQLAAVAGMIPLTIGGLGIREFTFFYGAEWLNRFTGAALDPEMGVVISLLVFAVTALSALVGLVWINRIRSMRPCDTEKIE